jgi:hypothetical protein
LLLGLFAVLISVRLCGFVGMHSRLALVTCSGVSVMSGLLVLASLMLLSSLIDAWRLRRCGSMPFYGVLRLSWTWGFLFLGYTRHRA